MKSKRSHAVSEAARAAAGARGQSRNAPHVRNLRLAGLLRTALSEIFADPDFLHSEILAEARLTVTEVDLSPDLSFARVRLLPLAASLGGQEALWDEGRITDLDKELALATGRIRHAVSEKVALKRTPRLDIRYDRHRVGAQDLQERLGKMSQARVREEAQDTEWSGRNEGERGES